MTGRVKVHNHLTSLRLPNEYHDWIAKFANNWNVPPAYVYRQCIREFISRQSRS